MGGGGNSKEPPSVNRRCRGMVKKFFRGRRKKGGKKIIYISTFCQDARSQRSQNCTLLAHHENFIEDEELLLLYDLNLPHVVLLI